MTPVALISGGAGDLAQAIRRELESQGWQVHAPSHARMDVDDKAQIQSFFSSLERLDLLVHNAGILRDAMMLTMEAPDFDAVLKTHLRGGFLCSQAALELMTKQRGGHIVHIGSFSGLSGPAGQANYAAAKAGLIGLTQSIAVEYGSRDIRANCILPGLLETQMTRPLLADAGRQQRILSAHALGRLNTCQDVARFIAFLQTMSHVSGQVFQLDSRIRRWA
ncbi:MAG: SDR family oxidoreductase [Prosthecobacter sp.]|nr:SDR family oxidoreductase [Prosthecobacter sp.]